ncbi:TPA: hypothetical protein DCZ46_03425 [Candidatus Campbellbacteria bacterium]|nr:MAG: peptidase M14, carboxypeptidase A [Candidatus Campbellbacteria bacterium GW2011_OD1_34_28]KKP74820.1 MAG: Peptidase M14, carboxypeptidase A [Candidatus Campbellbacteria bacterium GW2011_GWD2_35_24]KKP75706.1 MAG: peptidase M14, carboxypeptidase A [Candidatus Campbellbacteria bacterium GW2011_GWC2_35_28]KKP77046.1 MAG: Peptidase M14, carboxypeptidase A [Candidatus Campbellbacteria bacterium GW2011_GWC1_35_31]KKP78972.1 MAG: Peptidase M14, carboxypeptidase A [Candidatus Campbellbacteria b
MKKFFIGRAIGFIVVIVVFIIGYFILDFFKNDEIVEKIISSTKTIIGQSVEKRNIEAYTFGDGEKHLLFVGGIHGGYEWNSVLLAYQLIDYLEINKEIIPKDITVTVIASANPDGIFEVTNKNGRFYLSDLSSGDKSLARFNANDVDLNRNFDCKWQSESTWRGNPVSAGTSVFSEPEAQTIRDFVLENKPVAVVFFHSQSNAVYASECEDGILSETLDIMNIYSDASGYPAIDTFDAYEITGDAEGWLASIKIPAITVELSTHETIEWDKNLAGVKALFEYYSN